MSRSRRLLIPLILGLLLVPTTTAKATWAAEHNPAPAAAADSTVVLLNEVMPKAGSGGFEWVELYNSARYHVYLPLVLRSYDGLTSALLVRPAGGWAPSSASQEWVDISGWQVTDRDGNVYTIPAMLPPLPPGAFVRIIFDGLGDGANDYDLSDGSAVLHSPPGLTGIFEDAADQAALYTGGTPTAATLRDFVAWGEDPSSDANHAVTAGVWPAGAYLEFAASAGYIAEGYDWLHLLPNESVGRYAAAPLGWAVYRGSQLTPGAPNPVPQPGFYQPADGGTVDASNVVIGWSVVSGASGYRFQLSATSSFAAPLVDVTGPYPDYHHSGTLAPGGYTWRVLVIGPAGLATRWTAPAQFDAVDLSPLSAAGIQAEKTLGIVWQVQHKDTHLLDVSLEGENTRTGEGAWDAPHPDDHRTVNHDNHYCQVASMSMIASYYGADISQDRLSYYAIREHPESSRGLDPDRVCTDTANCMPDLKDDFWAGRNKGNEAQVWMLGYDYDDFSDIEIHSYNPPTTTIPFDDIRTWIDAGHPLMVMVPHHVMVIDGYRAGAGILKQVHLLDPWTAASWKPYTDTGSIQRILSVRVYPTLGTPPAPRSDEASVWTDSDGDGVYDFDELRRFHTDPFDPDTDGDWVPDKDDIEETVYDRLGAYVYTPEYADYDSDGDRKELDRDNDDDTAPDGCEDTNYNGIYQFLLGETHNFDSGSTQPCVPRLDILYPLEQNPANAGNPLSPDKILVQVSVAVPDGWLLTLTRDDFNVEIGGDVAEVVTVYPSSDTYWLVVAPPDKAAGTYDLTVDLEDQSDTEPYAVTYLPSRPNSSVIVLDRSGSMSIADKLGAAQNAASAFIDVLNDGDEVGVVSFGSEAGVEFGLTEIVNATVRENAIDAVDALTATGLTALGQGAKAGYAELLTGEPDNRWSLVLLSDGFENVEPYWNEVSPDITDAVVHTVALGDIADTSLLAQIAGEKHGTFFVVDVAPPSSALGVSAVTAGPVALPSTLPNRLADVYLAIGELELSRQRLWDASGSPRDLLKPFSVVIEPGMPEALFTLNWDNPLRRLEMSLTGPDGVVVPPDAEFRSDTHHQLRVLKPRAGTWLVTIHVVSAPTEYHFALSGKSPVTLMAAVGGDPLAHAIGEPIAIYGILSDNKPIVNATVYALIAGPAGVTEAQLGIAAPASLTTTVRLYDDGTHGDAFADDGCYTNEVVPTAAGGYSVKLVADGKSNTGMTFRRYAHAGFSVRHRAAYVWDDDLDTAIDYAGLLQQSDWIVDLIQLTQVVSTTFTPYALIVVGPDTGLGYSFDNHAAAGALAQWRIPILGLGDGGGALFYEYKLSIGYGNAWVSDDNRVSPVAPASSYWNQPYFIDTASQKLVTLYNKPLHELGIYLLGPAPKVITPIAREEHNEVHYPVITERTEIGREFTLWGYNLGPRAMTEDGRALLVNVTHAMR